jgi:hypothetical protein
VARLNTYRTLITKSLGKHSAAQEHVNVILKWIFQEAENARLKEMAEDCQKVGFSIGDVEPLSTAIRLTIIKLLT